MKHLLKVVAATALLALGATGASAATTLGLYGSWTPPSNSQQGYQYDDSVLRSQIACTVSCDALQSNTTTGTYSTPVPVVSSATGFGNPGDLFYIANQSDAEELAFANAATGSNYTLADYTKTNAGGVSLYTFTTNALYVLLKIGANPDFALIRNLSGGTQTYTYTAFSGQGAGLSHWAAVAPVPIPAAGFLLLAGLGGLAVMRRRKAAA